MSRMFYAKLAWENLKKNKSLYLPYIITAIGMSAMYYIMQAMTMDEGIGKMMGGDSLRVILILGCIVIAIFACIFLFYTNSFLMKRRKKEFGLFNILGMEKRHIGKMMFWETLMVSTISILGGLAAGIVLNKVVVLVLLRITHLDVPFGFSVSARSLETTVLLFIGIFAVTLLYNLRQVQKAKPVELLQSARQGEAEPKTRWIMTVVGAVALVIGYCIAIFTKDPLGTVLLFFVAVILVMIGTYCLFTAGSIAVLKMLRKNKKYYYQTAHFTSVSGMIYRMKQNAVGLANICILSTAVLVMISGTVSLYAGMESGMNQLYSREINIDATDLPQESRQDLLNMVEETAAEQGISTENFAAFESITFMGGKSDNEFNFKMEDLSTEAASIVNFMTLEEYINIGGTPEELSSDEILAYVYRGDEDDKSYDIHGKNLRIKKYLEEYPDVQLSEGALVVGDIYYIVVKDEAVLSEIIDIQKRIYPERANGREYQILFDLSGDREDERAFMESIREKIEEYRTTVLRDGTSAWVYEPASREEGREMFYVLYGGFLFLGIFLGMVFLLATVLIIYYKQISEGYEDKDRYEIMRKVGMSHKEVKASIKSQILKVFFLPLVMACVHLTAAFPMIKRLLKLFGMVDVRLFALCTVVTVAVFAVIYGLVYLLTARTYYKIVE